MKEYLSDNPDLSDSKGKEKLNPNFQSVLIGGAIGDTLGMPVEGWERDQIRRHIGSISEPIDPVVLYDSSGQVLHRDETARIPYVSPYLKKGQITDDTWLSISVGRSIVEQKGYNLENVAKHSLAIFNEQITQQSTITPQGTPIAAFLHPESEVPQPFGGTTIAAFENLKKGIHPTESGVMSRNPGNGPAIKVAPISMYMHTTDTYDKGLVFAEQIGKMTHLDPRSIVSGVVQAHAVYSLLQGVTRNEFLATSLQVCREWEKSKEQGKKVTLLERMQWVSDNKDLDEETAYQTLGVSWPVTKNYPFTLFMFQKNWDTPLEGLLKTVNFGGDCDSTAAMYGTLAGAKNGKFYPLDWEHDLERSIELKYMTSCIARLQKK